MEHVKVAKCVCKHEFQDERYGKGNRVHTRKMGTIPKWCCTVCSRIKD